MQASKRRMRDASHCRIILFDLGRKVLAVQFQTIDKNVTKENSKRSLGNITHMLEIVPYVFSLALKGLFAPANCCCVLVTFL